MLCDNCGKRPATNHYTTIIDGEKKTADLCAQCASELGYDNFFTPAMDFMDLFSGFPFMPQKKMDAPVSDTKTCPLCGSTLNDISDSGRVGCAECYSTFREFLNPYIKRIHGSATHTGRSPKSYKDSPEKILSKLRGELNVAIAAEDFEHAAKLRDEIRRITGEGAK